MEIGKDLDRFFPSSTLSNLSLSPDEYFNQFHGNLGNPNNSTRNEIEILQGEKSELIHYSIGCKLCKGKVFGNRFSCLRCQYDLCEKCQKSTKEVHKEGHEMLKMEDPRDKTQFYFIEKNEWKPTEGWRLEKMRSEIDEMENWNWADKEFLKNLQVEDLYSTKINVDEKQNEQIRQFSTWSKSPNRSEGQRRAEGNVSFGESGESSNVELIYSKESRKKIRIMEQNESVKLRLYSVGDHFCVPKNSNISSEFNLTLEEGSLLLPDWMTNDGKMLLIDPDRLPKGLVELLRFVKEKSTDTSDLSNAKLVRDDGKSVDQIGMERFNREEMGICLACGIFPIECGRMDCCGHFVICRLCAELIDQCEGFMCLMDKFRADQYIITRPQ